jgi:hypothetical protein
MTMTRGASMSKEHQEGRNSLVLGGSVFVLGVITGLFLKDAVKHFYEHARGGMWHREYDQTVKYDENLPESLGRREPAPYPGQPRFGGTGALGVSPASVVAARAGDADS